jgi:hypothetical protein
MKPIKWSTAVLVILSSLNLGGCAGFWDRHPGTQSGPVPDQSYWTDRTWRKEISHEWIEDDKRLSRMRMSEFIH